MAYMSDNGYIPGGACLDRCVGVTQFTRRPPRIDLVRSAPVPQTQAAPPPPTPPARHAIQTRAAPGHRFYWIRTTPRGPWIAAQAAYSDPAAGFFIPGVVRTVFATSIGDEIHAPPGNTGSVS